MTQRMTRKKTLSIFFNMADTFRKNFDDDTLEQVSSRRNNRRKSKAKLKTFSYNKQEAKVDYSDISDEWEDDGSFEKFTKRR